MQMQTIASVRHAADCSCYRCTGRWHPRTTFVLSLTLAGLLWVAIVVAVIVWT